MATCLYWLKNIKLKATIQVLNVSSFNSYLSPLTTMIFAAVKLQNKDISSFVMIPCVFYASSPFCELASVFSSSSSCSLQSTHTHKFTSCILLNIIRNSIFLF